VRHPPPVFPHKTGRDKLLWPGVESFGPSQRAEAVKTADAVVDLASTSIGIALSDAREFMKS
jgi:hypothetical protein